MKSRTGWVRPAERRKGQDHLAVQAVSAHVYAELVPGLTNVTDRIGCYSFYPWLLWACEQTGRRVDSDSIVEIVRRAECAVTLVGALHSLEDGDESLHVGGLTGRLTLGPVARRIAAGESVRLSQYATLDASDERYFKNRLGGLGQYYFGPLREVGVLAGEVGTGVKFTEERGAVLAELVNKHLDRSAFFRVIQRDRVDKAALRTIDACCPCRLERNASERDALRDLVLNRAETAFSDPGGQPRRETVALLLDVAASGRDGRGDEGPALAARFLDTSYAATLDGATPWRLPPALERARRRWAVYQRHELLSVSVQGLFWAGLGALEEQGGRAPNAEAYGSLLTRTFGRAAVGRSARPFREFLDEEARRLPPIMKVEDARHELRLADEVVDAFRNGDRERAVKMAVRTLAALVIRDEGTSPYADLSFPRGYFEAYEINLGALRRLAADTWQSMSGGDWLKWLGARWGVLAHLRIALRKLHYESLETFRIIPHDDGLEVVELPDVGWTNPRLAQLTRALMDLGLLDREQALTEAGADAREELREGD